MWDKRYDTDEFIYGKAPNGFLKSVASEISAGSRVLCLAEGEGRNAVYLASLGHDVVAVDASSVGLAKARRLAEEVGVEIETVVADLSDFPMESEGFDVIVSIFAHVPPPLRVKLHGMIAGALRPGGKFILEAYTTDQIGLGTGGPPVPALMMGLEGLEGELIGLDFQHGIELKREIIEGKHHTGVGAVVQVIGVKK